MTVKHYIEYEDYGNLVSKLTEQIRIHFDPDYIYTIPRGGLAIALHLSHALDCPIIIEPVKLIPTIMTKHVVESKILIVDDVCDSGETLIQTCATFNSFGVKDFKTATLHVKPRRQIEPDFYVENIPNPTWIIYPWEKSSTPNKDYMKFKE